MRDDRTVFERMAAVLGEMTFIAKQSGDKVSYEFRSIDALMNHLHGPLARHGLFLSPRVLDDWQLNMIPGTNNRVQGQALFRVCVDVYAEDGSMVTLGPGLAQSHDYGDKAVYQAQQNAVKYLLIEAFCIPTAEPDMDARNADEIPNDHAQLLSELDGLLTEAEAVGADGDPARARAYARRSLEHARKALASVQEKIDQASAGDRGEGSPAGGNETSTQDASAPDASSGEDDGRARASSSSPSPDWPVCDVCGVVEEPDAEHDLKKHGEAERAAKRDQDSHEEGGGASTVTDARKSEPAAESTAGAGEDAPPSSGASSPGTSSEEPWQRAERLGLGPAQVMVEVRNIVEDLKKEGHQVRLPGARQKIAGGTCDPRILEIFNEFLDAVEKRLSQPVGT